MFQGTKLRLPMRRRIAVSKTACLAFSFSALAWLLLPACLQKSKHTPKNEAELIARLVSTKAPAPQHPLDIRFESKLRLVGYDLSANEIREGQPFTVTWHWQVLSALDDGWQLFTHLADASQTSRLNLDGIRVIRGVYPEARWKAGEFIKDPQDITLPSDWNSNQATFYMGLWNGPKRLHVTTGPNDGKNRAVALTLPVVSSRPSGRELPRLIARRLTAPLVLDGKLDEADWAASQSTGPFVQTMTGAPGAFPAEARVVYDAQALYLGYQVSDEFLKTSFKNPDDHLWEQDTVEVMLDPDGDQLNYFEIQVSPAGVVFDTRYDSRRKPPPFGHLDWASNTRAKVVTSGKLNDDEADHGYTVEMAIPWSAFAAGSTPAAPPAEGAEWRVNFFVMDARPSGQRAVGWSAPLIGDFHTLDRFGRVIFPSAAVPPAATTPQTATPGATKPR